MPAFLACSSASFFARCGSGLSFGPFRPYRPSLFLEVFLPILPSSPLWRFPLPPCCESSFFLRNSGMSSSFSSGGLMRNFTNRLSELKRSSDRDFGSGGTAKIINRNRTRPMPVPTVIRIRCVCPRPAPKAYSPQAAALASFSTMTSLSSRSETVSRNGVSRQPGRFGANSTWDRSTSM